MLYPILYLSLFSALFCALLASLRLIWPAADKTRNEKQFTILVKIAVWSIFLGIIDAMAIILEGSF